MSNPPQPQDVARQVAGAMVAADLAAPIGWATARDDAGRPLYLVSVVMGSANISKFGRPWKKSSHTWPAWTCSTTPTHPRTRPRTRPRPRHPRPDTLRYDDYGAAVRPDCPRHLIEMAINHALRMMTHDVMQRPGDKAVRKVVIEIEAKPVLDKTSAALDTIEHRFKVDARLPKRVSDVYPMLPMADDTVSFQPASPGDPRQAVMFDEGDDDVPAGVNPETGEVIDDDSTGSD